MIISVLSACDAANPSFSAYDKVVDPKTAAKNVQCIHTAAGTFGTANFNCDQDWLMGKNIRVYSHRLQIINKLFTPGYCGVIQAAAKPLSWARCFIGLCNDPEKQLSHMLCNNFYISAFDNDFVASINYLCPFTRLPSSLPSRFKMGYKETRRR
jgi:hypothetical protein